LTQAFFLLIAGDLIDEEILEKLLALNLERSNGKWLSRSNN
jgi:hypothetical protein